MTDPQIGLAAVACLLVLLCLKVPIAISLIAVSFGGIWVLLGLVPAMGMLRIIPYSFAASWQLSSVPMFLLMGFLTYHTGITKGLFQAARVWLARLPGGLAIASIFGSAGFASVTGSSVACSAAMGRIAVPEMLSSGYKPALATGAVAAAGTLGALIPPSVLFIIYGIIAQVPISSLFLGGVGVGLLTAGSYIAIVLIWSLIDPKAAPMSNERHSLRERLVILANVAPIVLLGVLVFGGLFLGIFTPTEAGAVGAGIAAVIALVQGELTLKRIITACIEAFTTSAAIFAISIGANLFARFVALSGTDDLIKDAILVISDNSFLLMAGIVVLYLILGMFLDPIGAMLLTLPILLPIARTIGMDLIWFGVLLAKLLEVGMISPPIGLNVFVIKNVIGPSVTLGTIFRGVAWFILADLLVIVTLIEFPGLALFLPSLQG